MARRKGQAAIEKKANALERLAIEYVGVDDVKPNTYNPNRQSEHDFELLLKSMREDGFTQPIIVQAATMEIVDGEHRWRAARELGMTEVPVVKVDMDPAQMKISTLRHNRARGNEDIDLTAALLRDLEKLGALDWAQDSLMLDDVELQRLIDDVSAPDALAGEVYGEAWEPGSPSAEGTVTLTSGRDVAMTASAADTLRDREARIAVARTEEDKAMIRRDTSVYRLSLVFAADEADVVKAALEPDPAGTILALCRAQATSDAPA